MHIQSRGGSMGTISACRSRGNKNARVARALARYARRTGPPFSLNILRSILRTFGGTVSPFFFMNGHCISRTRDMKVAVTTTNKKRFALHCATAKNLRFRDHSRICGMFAKLWPCIPRVAFCWVYLYYWTMYLLISLMFNKY